MGPEILLNVAWVVWAWTAAVAGCVLLLRGRPAVLRRQLCRLGLVGVPVAMLGAGLWHANWPGAGLWVRHVPSPTASVGAASEPAPSVDLTGAETASLPPAAADGLPVPSGAATKAEDFITVPAATGESHVPVRIPVAPPVPLGPPANVPSATEATQAGEWWRWPLYPAGGVSLLMLLALGFRQLRLTVWRRTWRPAGPAWQSLTARLARRVGLRRPVRAFTAERLRHPAAAGVIRHAILLPIRYPQPLGLGLRGVLAHELAHLRGRDPLWNLISGAVLALGWWCPLTWWLHRRMQIESELTADDHALAAGAAPVGFAETLTRLAESGRPRPVVVTSGMACHLRRRIKMMLNERIPHNPRSPLHWPLGLAAGACVLVAALISTPLVGVVRADDPKPAAVEAESTTAKTDTATAPETDRAEPADVAGAGADSDRARTKARLAGKLRLDRTTAKSDRRRTPGHEVVSLRIHVKGGRLVIETAKGHSIVPKGIVPRSTPDAGKTSFKVQSCGDSVVIIPSPARADYTAVLSVKRTMTRQAAQVRAMRICSLQHSTAPAIASIVAKAWGAHREVKITPDVRLNAVVVQGTRSQIEAIAAMVKKLDVPGAASKRPAGPALEVNVYPLKHAKAVEVVQVLGGLLDDRPGVKLMILRGSNAIVVQGTKADMARIQELLMRLDTVPHRPATGEKAAPKKRSEPPAKVKDAQLRVLLGEAETRVIDLEMNLRLAELHLVRVKKARQNQAATVEEVESAKIKLGAAKKKLDSAWKELKELQQLLKGSPSTR